MQSSPASRHLLLAPNITFITLFLHTRNVYSSLSVRDQVWHPYKTVGRIMVLNILMVKFLERRREDKRLQSECQ
jgi:hypothetical protein